MLRKFSLLATVALTLLGGCQTEHLESDPSALGTDYFPLITGEFRIYDVQEITYTFPSTIDTLVYQLKETVADSIDNLAGGVSYVLNRQKKYPGSSDWIQDSVWTARKDMYTAVQVENNVPVIKLAFPVKEGKQWDANSLNDQPKAEYKMESVGLPANDSIGNYDKTITVVQNDFDDGIVKKDVRKEIYGKNIGLVYKESVILNYCTDENCLGQRIIETGKDLEMKLTEHGQN